MRALVLVLVVLAWSPLSFAESHASVEQFLAGLQAISTKKCAIRGQVEQQFAAQGKLAEAHSVRLGETMICECVPNGLQQLAQTLPTQELTAIVSEQEFHQRYMSTTLSRCSVAQVRATYGEGCAVGFAKARPNSVKYCSCMRDQVNALADDTVFQMASESATYIAQAGEAKKQGLRLPAQPASVQRYSAMNAACAAP